MENETEVSTVSVADNNLERVAKQIAGGDNVNAQASLNQMLQDKKDAALERKKNELARAITADGWPEEIGAPVEEE
tara:strand:- start:210 stop:437 length:228 start_codon:yes stop_codon:yes gene_type:complete